MRSRYDGRSMDIANGVTIAAAIIVGYLVTVAVMEWVVL